MHQVNVQIRFNDIDIAGHVNNAVYLYYYDYGRMQYFNVVFGEQTNWKEDGLVIVNINVDYLEPIFINDDVSVHTTIVKVGNKSLHMEQFVKNNKTRRIHSKCKTVLVAFNYNKKTSFEIPEKWRKKIQEMEKLFNS